MKMKTALKIHKQLGQFKEVARQRNELLALLKSVVPLLYARCDKSADASSQYQAVCAAIARAEGKEVAP